jgi:hypothetical protein
MVFLPVPPCFIQLQRVLLDGGWMANGQPAAALHLN